MTTRVTPVGRCMPSRLRTALRSAVLPGGNAEPAVAFTSRQCTQGNRGPLRELLRARQIHCILWDGQSPVRSIAGGCAQARGMHVCSGPIWDRKAGLVGDRHRGRGWCSRRPSSRDWTSSGMSVISCLTMPGVVWGCPPSCGRTSRSIELEGS